LLERLAATTDRHTLQAPLRAVFLRWMKAIESLAREAGVPAATARLRAEDAVVRIEGSLVLAAGTGDVEAFARALRAIRKSLLA
jgi:TetR/AcrR family transcriptional repressor of lmrAB and yxaGH operons